MTEKKRKRIIKHGLLYIKRGATIRSVAEITGSNHGTVHKDLYLLEEINYELYLLVINKIKNNLDVRSAKGGETTRKKWERKKKKK